MKLTKILSLIIMTGLLVSCGDDDEGSETRELQLSISGLEDLGSGYAYEGWVIVNGSPVSTGTFTVDANGTLSQTSFTVNEEDADIASAFVVSIEPAPDSDPAPSNTKLLNGAISNGTASLGTSVVGDFTNPSGSFFLRTPTDETGDNNGNDQYGVWFGVPGAPPTADFNLPSLPPGWAYEGWVVGETGPLTTGIFTSFSTPDDGAPFSGPQSGPPVPGEDFFENAPSGETFPLDVRGRTVVISIEPVPDNSPAPFVLKPLVGTAGQDTAPATYSFGENLGSFPSGSVSIN